MEVAGASKETSRWIFRYSTINQRGCG